MPRILVLLTVLLVPLVGGTTQPVAADSPTVDVIAHRGASRVAPENTLRAVRAAVRAGADMVEVDVRLTADRELVLVHDATLTRTTDVEQQYPDRAPWYVGDFTLRELRELDAGSWKDERFAGEHVPTLAQALRVVEGRSALLIELKDPVRDACMEALIAEHITADGTATGPADPRHEVVIQSFDYLAVARFAALQPDVPAVVLTTRAPSATELKLYGQFADGLAPPQREVDRTLVADVQRRGLRITPYTVNDRPTMRRLIRWGVDGVVSDVPGRLQQVRAATS